MRLPGRLRISWQDDTTLKVETDTGTQTRLLRFGAAPAPAEPTWQGHSVAQWNAGRARTSQGRHHAPAPRLRAQERRALQRQGGRQRVLGPERDAERRSVADGDHQGRGIRNPSPARTRPARISRNSLTPRAGVQRPAPRVSETRSASQELSVTMGARETPAVEFDGVSLAFDEHVVLNDVSFIVPKGRMTDHARRQRRWEVRRAQAHSRPAPAGFRHDSRQWSAASMAWPSSELLRMRADIGMLFQENALFDSLTVAENVGYRLSEEIACPDDEVRAARRRRFSGSSVSPNTATGCRRSCQAVSAGASPSRAPWRRGQACCSRRSDDGPRSDHRHVRRRRDRQAARSGARHVHCRDASDPRRRVCRDSRSGAAEWRS